MDEATQKRLALRDGFKSTKPIMTVGAHDAMTARLIEKHGFDAVWVSGLGVSTMAHAMPDVNLITMTEALEASTRIDRATSLPVVADCDNGFGGLNNVVRTALDYERAGLAGICIEDNLFPKKNSLLGGKLVRELIPMVEQARRIEAAKNAQRSDEFVFMARTEALIADLGTDEACRRADAYVDAGADALLVHSKDPTFRQLEDFLNTWKGVGTTPIVAVPTLYPQVSADDLFSWGVNMVIFANQTMRAAVNATEEVLKLMSRDRDLLSADASVAELEYVFDIVDTRAYIHREEDRA